MPNRGTHARNAARDQALHTMDRWVDPILFFLAATSIPMVIVQTGAPTDADSSLITGTSWLIWGAFTLNFVVRMALATDRRAQLRYLAWDLILIIGQPVYTIGDRKADAVLALLRLLVIAGRSLQKGRVLRRTGNKFRANPLRVVAFIVPFLWLTSAALIYRTETEAGVTQSYGDGLWWSAVTMATVGYGDISPKSTNGRAVAILTMIVGIGLFSLITAKLAEVLFIHRTRGNRREVLQSDHTLVLGWSPKVFTIIEQLVIANASRPDASVVVFAPRDHNDMTDDINAHVPSLARSTTTVITRRGTPGDPSELAVCRPDRARSIIIIDDSEEDASVVRTVLALMNGGRELPDIPVIAEIDNPATADALQRSVPGLTVVNPTAFVARTAAQACRSAGVANAYEDLLDFDGSELYVVGVDHDAPATYGEWINAFADACVVGHRSALGRCRLNPPMDTEVAPGDRLIVVAEDDSMISNGRPGATVHADTRPAPTEPPEHVVIFGWNPLCPRIVRELDAYVPEGSSFTVVVDSEMSGGAEQHHPPVGLANASYELRSATANDYAELVDVIASEQADHAIVLCYRNGISIAEADAHALVTTLQVRHALHQRGGETTVITELLDQRDVALAPPSAAGDFIVSDRLISLLLTQLAENSDLKQVFDDLLDPNGAELYCKPAARYCAPGEATTFGAIVDAAAGRGESALGYRTTGATGATGNRAPADPADGAGAGRAFGTVINPLKSQPIALAADDQVIVIANRG